MYVLVGPSLPTAKTVRDAESQDCRSASECEDDFSIAASALLASRNSYEHGTSAASETNVYRPIHQGAPFATVNV